MKHQVCKPSVLLYTSQLLQRPEEYVIRRSIDTNKLKCSSC